VLTPKSSRGIPEVGTEEGASQRLAGNRPSPCCPARTGKGRMVSFREGRRRAMRYLIAGLALAGGMCVGHTRRADEVVVEVERIQDIQLTADQESKIEEIRKECGPEVQKAVKNLVTLRKEELEKVREVLTADQKAKLKEMKEERKERRHRCMAHRFAHLKE